MRTATLSLLPGLVAFGRAACPVGGDSSILANNGTANGTFVVNNNITMYISFPPLFNTSLPLQNITTGANITASANTTAIVNGTATQNSTAATGNTTAILYLTDVFGLSLSENLLLADSFARAGYLTVAPDLFNGTPAPGDINVPGFNTTLFLSQHQPNVTDPIIASTISYLRSSLGVTRIGAAGYCYGGRYAFRFLDGNDVTGQEERVDVAFTAHPSLLQNEEILKIKGPVSVAAAENDGMMPPERRAEIEALLRQTGREYMVSLYSGTGHGFAIRADVNDRAQRFAKESAFLQAVRWFGEFL